jgi:hypothetical protein
MKVMEIRADCPSVLYSLCTNENATGPEDKVILRFFRGAPKK